MIWAFKASASPLITTQVQVSKQYSERELPEEQTGFHAGKGTRDALFVLQLVIEKTIDTADKELYLTFIDYRKAFDMVNESQKAL